MNAMDNAPGERGVAVTVTPVAAARDSRSLKQAASLARFGYRSILFEGKRSDPPPELAGVEVTGSEAGASHGQRAPGPAPARSGLRQFATSPQASRVAAFGAFVAYLLYYAGHFVLGGLRRLPAASLYYLNEYSFFPAVWAKARMNGSCLIYDARDFYSGMETAKLTTPFQRLVSAFGVRIERRCIRRADIFVTVSDGVADLYEHAFGRRPAVIRNVHDTRLDRTPQVSLRNRTGLLQGEPILVVVGQAKPGRELSGVRGALAKLPRLHLALVGNGYRQALGEQPAEIAARIHYIENVPATEVVPLIREADASLIVYYARSENYKNALPNGFFQSVAAGLPVLHSEIPEISRICRELDFGAVVEPDDVAGLVGLLGNVVERNAWFQDQKRRSEKAALALTWQREEEKLARLILDATARRRAMSETG